MLYVFMFFFTAVFSWSLTAVIYKYALSTNMIDIPNERSSHTVPTPRGGGVAVVLSYFFTCGFFFIFDVLPFFTFLPLVIGGSLIAFVGFLDDLGHIAAKWRLLIHFLSASIFILTLSDFPNLIIFGQIVDFSYFSLFFGILYIVWMLNLFNFMDGIDGLASVETIFVSIGTIICSLILNDGAVLSSSILLAILLFSILGFLIWNFPPAKIFMGDACSGFLGFTLSGISILATLENNTVFWCWITLLAVFISDSTYTLICRLLRGKNIHIAHRSHAYQHAAQHFGAHITVVMCVVMINVLWLLPLSMLIAFEVLDGFFVSILAYIPIIFVVYKFRAGFDFYEAPSSIFNKE